MPSFGLAPQNAVVMKLLKCSDGRPMGKSLKNFIPIEDTPNEMYGKIMSIVDDVIFDYFELVTRVPMEQIAEMKNKVKLGQNPMLFKKQLAKEIVSFYHGEKKAHEAEENFSQTFQKGQIPEEMQEVNCKAGELLSEVLVENKILSSKGEWRRLVLGKAVHDLMGGQNITDVDFKTKENLTLKIGKKKFIKIKIK